MDAVTLGSEIEVTFVPSAGMVACSLRHRGDELLGQRGGLSAYVERRSTMGIPLLHPWANRLSEFRFELAGREVDLERASTKLDPNGLPIHGLLAADRGWEVLKADPAALSASFDFGARPDLLAAFPFPHTLRIHATVDGATARARRAHACARPARDVRACAAGARVRRHAVGRPAQAARARPRAHGAADHADAR